MKKLLLIFVIIGIVFIAGCIGGEKATDTKPSTDSQTNQKTVAEATDLIIKQSDVPGLTLVNSYFIAYSKSSSFNYTEMRMGIRKSYNCIPKESSCKDALPIGNRDVGRYSTWKDDSGRFLSFELYYLDSNDGIEKSFAGKQEWCKVQKLDCGSPNIGVISNYESTVSKDIASVDLQFVHKNYYVTIKVLDEKENSLKEAIRIAKIVESRLS